MSLLEMSSGAGRGAKEAAAGRAAKAVVPDPELVERPRRRGHRIPAHAQEDRGGFQPGQPAVWGGSMPAMARNDELR